MSDEIKSKRVIAGIDDIKADKVEFSFEDPEIGWWSADLPRSSFPCEPQVRMTFTLEVGFIVGKGLEHLAVVADQPFTPYVESEEEKKRRQDFPVEPTDYDDPKQLADYTERLRVHFHLPEEKL